MIQGTVKTEAQYRAIYLDSSSSLKDFSMDRKKYHKKYILNEVMRMKIVKLPLWAEWWKHY